MAIDRTRGANDLRLLEQAAAIRMDAERLESVKAVLAEELAQRQRALDEAVNERQRAMDALDAIATEVGISRA